MLAVFDIKKAPNENGELLTPTVNYSSGLISYARPLL